MAEVTAATEHHTYHGTGDRETETVVEAAVEVAK
jgi:hypothetical protein